MQFWNAATPTLSRAAFAAMAEMSIETEIIKAMAFTEKVCQTLSYTINTKRKQIPNKSKCFHLLLLDLEGLYFGLEGM